MYKKVAIITGISGQDGAYLSKLLLEKGYRVIGLVRSHTQNTLFGLKYLNIETKVEIIECDLIDISQVFRILKETAPTEIYNLSAQSSVSISFKQPISTINYNITSVLNLLEAIRLIDKSIKLYQASSSEMYGKVNNLPITENSILHPLSPYAISKASAHWACINYRESYGLFVGCGILFNHESHLRNSSFFVKKIIQESIKISKGKQLFLKVGNIDVKRDFGYAPLYVEAMYLMLQQKTPNDYIICSGKSISLRSIVTHIFDRLGIESHKFVVDSNLYRPTDIENIYGDNSKAKKELQWNYSLDFYDVIDNLLEEELQNSKIE